MLILGSIAGYYWYQNSQNNKDDYYFINYDEPTEQEQKAGDSQKDKNIEREKLENDYVPPANGNYSTALVQVNSAGLYDGVLEVRATVTGVYEDGGVCEAILTRDGATVKKTSQAFRDATTVQCGALDISRSEFNKAGAWNLSVSYGSGTAKGSSDSQIITIN